MVQKNKNKESVWTCPGTGPIRSHIFFEVILHWGPIGPHIVFAVMLHWGPIGPHIVFAVMFCIGVQLDPK